MKVLSGQLLGTLGSLAAGFTAGAAGNLAGQGLAKFLGLQKNIDLRSTLMSGLSTAASVGFFEALNTNQGYAKFLGKLGQHSPSNFNLAAAVQGIEQDALGQGINLALQNHQHFNWQELASRGIYAAVGAGKLAQDFNQGLKEHLGEFGKTFLDTELNALATGSMQSKLGGGHFDAKSVLRENLGSSIGSGFLNTQTEIEERDFYESISQKANELWNDYGETALAYGPKALGLWLRDDQDLPNKSLSEVASTAVTKYLRKTYSELTSAFLDTSAAETRIEGGLEALSGTLEMSAATALMEGTFGISLPLSSLIYNHGCDHFLTGALKAITGKTRETVTHNLLRKASFSETQATLFDTGLSLVGSPLAKGALAGKTIWYRGFLGAISGGYGSFITGGDSYDLAAGTSISAAVAMLGFRIKPLGNPYVGAGLANALGQFYANKRDAQNNNYSFIYFGFSLAGAGVANFTTKAIPVSLTKTMVDTMYTGSFNAIGNQLGKQRGW
jgi:hypothetical protein